MNLDKIRYQFFIPLAAAAVYKIALSFNAPMFSALYTTGFSCMIVAMALFLTMPERNRISGTYLPLAGVSAVILGTPHLFSPETSTFDTVWIVGSFYLIAALSVAMEHVLSGERGDYVLGAIPPVVVGVAISLEIIDHSAYALVTILLPMLLNIAVANIRRRENEEDRFEGI